MNPNKTPSNLSNPDAPDHLTRPLKNFITKPPRNKAIIKTTTYEIIFDISGLPINSFILGVARNSKFTAAKNAITHMNNERNSFTKPLVIDKTTDAVMTTIIVQSTKFNPKASMISPLLD